MKASLLNHIILKSFEEYGDALIYYNLLKKLNHYNGKVTIAPVSYGYGVYITEDLSWCSLSVFIEEEKKI